MGWTYDMLVAVQWDLFLLERAGRPCGRAWWDRLERLEEYLIRRMGRDD